MVRVKARYAVPAVAAGVALLPVLIPGLDVLGTGSQGLSLGGVAGVFVLTTITGALAVLRWRRVARSPFTNHPPPPTDPRVPFVLYDEGDPEGTAPLVRAASAVSADSSDRDSPVLAPATPEHSRVLRLLVSVPERAVTTPAAAELSGLTPERVVPLLADLTRARLVERDPVADLWRVTEHGMNL